RTIGAQLYSDAVTLGAATTQFISIGNGAITFAATLDGASAVTVTSGGPIALFGAIGGVTPLISLSVNGGGTIDLNAGTITTSGEQGCRERGVLTADTVLTGVNVTFAQTVNSDGTPRALTVHGRGLTTFGGAIGTRSHPAL